MNVCANCGTMVEDTASFCTNCGTKVVRNYPAPSRIPSGEPVSILGWIGRSLIPYIPLVGGIVYLIMLFIWSGDRQKEETFRNWAKAQLILTAVGIILAILFAVIYGVALAEILDSL